MGEVTQKARDLVCPGCGGKGGVHTSLSCAYLRDELDREARKDRKGK